MQRLVGRSVLASAVLLALYACGGSGASDTPGTDAGDEPDGSTADDSGTTTLPVDGGTADGARDAHADATVDAPTDAPIDAAVDAPVDAPIDAPGVDAAVAPSVRYVGRRDLSDPENPKFGWPGARIIARFMGGTDVTVTLDETPGPDSPSRWDVLLDGVRTSTLTPANGMGTYTIAAGLDGLEHTIELYKRTEGKFGVTQFRGFQFLNGGVLLSPPVAPDRRIEFLGDSGSTGYGNECATPSEVFSSATHNERLAFTGLIAADLGADHHNIAYSGKGVLLNNFRADTVVFEDLYPRVLPVGPISNWLFTSFTPDVVWITLGANDWDQESAQTNPPVLSQFTNKFVALTALVRSKYAGAHIFVSIAPSLNDDYPVKAPDPPVGNGAPWNALTNMRTAVANVVATRDAAGDKKIYAYEFVRAIYPGELTGCRFHANLALHRKMADQAIVQIKAKTMWP